MSDALSRALGHYAGLSMRRLAVEEWGDADGPFYIYWKPWLPLERSEVFAGQKSEHRLGCAIVERKALNAAGERLFAGGDAFKLERGAHEAVISRIARLIAADLDEDAVERGEEENVVGAPEKMGTREAVEQAEKN